ncbi:MAG: DUF1203 domain-containing protein [Acidobacteriota bacterium]
MNKLIPFQMIGLPIEKFDSLLSLSDEALQALGAKRMVADKKPGYPCRASLIDAEPGETVLLLPFSHHDVASSYRASGPIFVRADAQTARPAINEVPAMLRSRLLSIRAYDEEAMMVGSDVVNGSELEEHISRFFDDPSVKYLHLHNARPGCFNCRVERA